MSVREGGCHTAMACLPTRGRKATVVRLAVVVGGLGLSRYHHHQMMMRDGQSRLGALVTLSHGSMFTRPFPPHRAGMNQARARLTRDRDENNNKKSKPCQPVCFPTVVCLGLFQMLRFPSYAVRRPLGGRPPAAEVGWLQQPRCPLRGPAPPPLEPLTDVTALSCHKLSFLFPNGGCLWVGMSEKGRVFPCRLLP